MEKLNSLDFTLVMGCRLNCFFCPQDLLMNKYFANDRNRKKTLSFEDFKIALDRVEPGASISFCGMSEPFLNKECADMLVYANDKGYKLGLYTTLMGMKMEDYEKIKDIPFNRLVLHIPEAEGITHFEITEEYLEILRLVHEHMRFDYYSCHGTVHPAIQNIIFKEKLAPFIAQNRAGNLKVGNLENHHKKGKIICYRAFSSSKMDYSFTPVLLPDGTLLLCCQDFGMRHPLGNLLSQSWEEIKKGEQFQTYIRGLEDESADTLCRQCAFAQPIEILPSMRLHECAVKERQGNLNKEQFSDRSQRLIERFAHADTVCVFGVGKLFREHFYQEYWDKGLNVSLFSDNNQELHNTEIRGTQCVSPDQLTEYSNLLVVLFVKNGCDEITAQLKSLGITNCISIDEVLDGCNLLCEEEIHYAQ